MFASYLRGKQTKTLKNITVKESLLKIFSFHGGNRCETPTMTTL